MRLISVDKDWKHVLTQKVVSPNTCCDIACLTFQLPHITTGFYRAMLCIRGTSHGPVSVCVCLCLCLSQAGVLLKRQNVGSYKQHHTIPQDSSLLVPKISAKFKRCHPLRGRQVQVGWVKIGDFRQITGYISKTVQDRHMVTIKVE